MDGKPRYYHLHGGEIPAEWIERRGYIGEESEWEEFLAKMREKAIEIAPGVHVTLMGTGDSYLPDGKTHWGAKIAVWDENNR